MPRSRETLVPAFQYRQNLRRTLEPSSRLYLDAAGDSLAPVFRKAGSPEQPLARRSAGNGDCVREQGILSFSPTGEGRWRATIHPNHTTNRDIWHMSFNVLDAAGHQVFPVFIGDSPAMFGSPSPRIPWAVDFNFSADQFRAINRIAIRSSC